MEGHPPKLKLLFASSVAGAIAILVTTVAGTAVGSAIEARIGRPVVGFEMITLGVLATATPAGIASAVGGALSRRWWRGLAIGLLAHGLLFGWLFGCTMPAGYPFDVNCWAFIVATIGGGAAGAAGGAVAQWRLRKSPPRS